MRLKLSKCSISLSYVRFYMHDRLCGCGLGVVIVIQTPCLSERFEISPWPKGSDNRGWTVFHFKALFLMIT